MTMNNMKTTCKLVGYDGKYVPFYILSGIVKIILNAFAVYIDLYTTEHLIEMLELNDTKFIDAFIFIIMIVGITTLIKIIIIFNNGYVRMRCRHKWIKKIQHELFDRAKLLHIGHFDDPIKYDQLSRAMNQDLRSINAYDALVDMLNSVFQAAVLVAYIVVSVPILFVVTLVASTISLLCYLKINKINHGLYKNTESERRVQGYVNRTFYLDKYAMDVKTTTIPTLLIDMQEDAYKCIEEKSTKVYRKTLPLYYCEDFMYHFINAFVTYAYLMYKVFFKGMLLSKFVTLSGAVSRFNSRFYNLSHSFSSYNRNMREISDFMWLMNYQEENQDNLKNASFNDSIKLDNVCFKYPNEEGFSLQNINMTIKKGEKIAIIGYNGAGKTTLTKLMLKLYNPDSGSVLMDDETYLDFKDRSITKQFTTVLQNFQIYCATVSENVLMKEVETKEEEELVVRALQNAGLYDKIKNLPNGINTILTKEFSNEGLELSGGERQKLAIARVFASNAQIAILDEPTSALDPLAEKEVNDRILKLADEINKTIIIISHRLSTIVNVDYIYMLDSGKIVEEGTHLELMHKHGKYYELFEAQAKLYNESLSKHSNN